MLQYAARCGSTKRTPPRGSGVSRDQVHVQVRHGLAGGRALAEAAGSVRTLQECEQGRKVPSGAAQSLLKLVSRHPELLAELAA